MVYTMFLLVAPTPIVDDPLWSVYFFIHQHNISYKQFTNLFLIYLLRWFVTSATFPLKNFTEKTYYMPIKETHTQLISLKFKWLSDFVFLIY